MPPAYILSLTCDQACFFFWSVFFPSESRGKARRGKEKYFFPSFRRLPPGKRAPDCRLSRAQSPQALCQRLVADKPRGERRGDSGGRGQLDSSRLPDDRCHRDVTISEARDFAGFRKWRRRRCWMLKKKTNFFHNLDPICVCFLVGYIYKHLFF